MNQNTNHKAPKQISNGKFIVIIVAVVISMFSLAFFSVPLYRAFCQITGFGGTTQVSSALPETLGTTRMKILFDANTSPELPWKFTPLQHQVDVLTGENKLIFYEAENIGDTAVTGVATFNVTPTTAGIYFNKIQCFCFENQSLNPGEKIIMPVSFFVDPEIENDPETDHIREITLSYTFFKAKKE